MQDQYAQERNVAGAVAAICFAVDGMVHGPPDAADLAGLFATLDRSELELCVLAGTTLLINVVEGRLDFGGDLYEFHEWLRQIAELENRHGNDAA
jgi:hypothetical protein